MNTHFWFAAILAALSFTIYQTTTIGRHLMATQQDVDALTAQVVKIGDEVKTAHAVLVAELADVKAQLAAAGSADKVDLTGLAAAIQNVDDINPDPTVEARVEQPAEEPAAKVVDEALDNDPPF